MKFGKISSEAKDPNSRHHDFGMEPDSVSFRECISEMPDNFIGVVYFILRQSLALHEILQNVSWWLFLAPNFGRFLVSPHHWTEVKNYRMSSNHKVLTNQGFEQNTSKNKNFQGRRKTAAGLKNKP